MTLSKIWTFIKAHFWLYFALAVATALVFMALCEYDARKAAEDAVKQAQSTIAVLQAKQGSVASVAKSKVVALQKEAKSIATPEEAVQALVAPTPAEQALPIESPSEPLHAEPVPDAPSRVSVDALPLYQTLNTCKQDDVNLDACTQELGIQKQIDAEKDVEITALKKKPSFWHRVGKVAKTTACAGIGGAAGGFAKGGEGAALGATAGALVCQLF